MKDFFLTGLILKIRAARQETCRQAVRTSLSAHSSSIWKKSSLPIFSRCPGTPSGGAPILAATFVTLSLLLASCSRASVQPQAPVQSPSLESEPASESLTADFPADIPVDYDLTKMNANMVYAQVFNLMLEPQKFENSTFKIQGSFIKANGPEGQPVYAVIIKDALACCQQGLEFIWDFAGAEPQIEQEILVIGKYTLTTTPDGLDHNYLAAQICQVLPH